MELCTCGAISNPKIISLSLPQSLPLRPNSSLSLNHLSLSRPNPGRVYPINSSLRASSSEEISSQYIVEDSVTTSGEPVTSGYQAAEKNSNVGETVEKEDSTEDTPTDEQTLAFEFLDKLDVKLDSESTPSVLLLGGGSLIVLWIVTVLVGAIDSIPLFPKLMEVVGLAYTLWFSTRYLLFKENRDELVVKIEEIKQQVLGSSEDD